MSSMKSLFGRTLFKSSIPLFISGVFYLTEGLISRLKISGRNHGSTTPHLDETTQFHNLRDIIGQMKALSLSAYASYFNFLVAMLIINFLLEILISNRRTVDKSKAKVINKDIEGLQNPNKSLIKQLDIKKCLISIFCYTLTFLLIQTIGLLVFTKVDPTLVLEKTSHSLPISQVQGQEELFISPLSRMLEEEKEISQQIMSPSTPSVVPEKISFSIARVLGSLDLPLSSIVLSKDETLAFVIVQTFGTLKIINVSDPQSPVVKASLDLARPIEFYGQKALFLSPDEKILFVSNFKYLEIVDVSDPLSPKLLGTYNENDLSDKKSLNTLNGQFITTMAVSIDKKNLFVGGLGLQIFDISNANNPKIIFKKLNDLNAQFPLPGSVALSANGRNLFVANGVTLEIYDVSNPSSPQLRSSLKKDDFLATSVFLADDNKTAYVTGNSQSSELIIEKIDISNLEAPVVSQRFVLVQRKDYFLFTLGASPRKTQLYIAVYKSMHFYTQGFEIGVFDLTKNALINDDQSLLNFAYSIVISADGKKAFAAAFSQFVAFELFSNYPNSHVLSLSKNSIGSFKTENEWTSIFPSADSKILFVSPESEKNLFEIWNITNQYSPTLISSVKNVPVLTSRMIVAPNYQRAFLFSSDRIFTVDLTNIFSPTLLPNFLLNQSCYAIQAKASKDAKTLFVLMKTESGEKKTFLSIIDYSDVNAIKEISRVESLEINESSKFDISQDEKTLYMVQSTSEIYDISDLAKPTLLTSFSILRNEPQISTYSVILSPDSKTLFTELYDVNWLKKLRIFDVSNMSSITMISETYLPMFEFLSHYIPFQMTPDFKTGYFFQKDRMLALNLTDPAAPTLSGVVPILNSTSKRQAAAFILSSDGRTAFTYCDDMELTILDLQLRYTLFINQESFLLGKKYSDGVILFKKVNGEESYTPLSKDSFKFLTLSMLDFKIALNRAVSEMKFSSLPSWISFDWNNHVLTIDAKRQADIGNYTLYSTASKKIPMLELLALSFVNYNVTILRDLITTLESLNYIDNELFLTSKFGNSLSFILTSQFTEYESQIYDFLKRYWIETSTKFEVKESSSLLQLGDNKFAIMTPSSANIRVEIILHPNLKSWETEGQFVFKPYASLIPVISEKKSRLKLEGPLDEINQALREIVVNYEHETWCDGEITFMDNMNPPVNRGIRNISKYFLRNEPPKLNPDVVLSAQEQVMISPVYTGQYFTINLNKSTFVDEHLEDLNYHLLMAKEPHELPNWLIFEDLTIKGTPPEQVLGREIELVLQVKNEFKALEVPLKLHVNISSTFILKLVMRYAPYILTAIGLYVSANKVYNIVGQKRYKHRKEFFIKVGEEVTPRVIYPVCFIRDEKKESKVLLKRVLEEVIKERGSCKKAEVLNYFMTGEGQLDKQKIIRVIRRVFKEMPNQDKKDLLSYGGGQSSKMMIIHRLIINELIKWQIDSKGEKETRMIFEKIKNQWIDVVDWDMNSSGFVVNSEKFEKIIDCESHESRSTIIGDESQMSLRKSLIGRQINMSLLKDAILAYAFEDHNIEKNSILVEVVVKQRVNLNFLFRAIKYDLKEIHLNEKSKLDYGINYKIQGDCLYFYGIPHASFGGKTIVVQIINRRRRILKEIWMYGSSSKQFNESFGENDEIDIAL